MLIRKITSLILILLLCSVTKTDAQHDIKAIFKLKSLNAIYQLFGKANVAKQETDITFGDYQPTEYVINKWTPNEFSILFDDNEVKGLVIRSFRAQRFANEYLKTPYNLNAGMTLEQLSKINKAPFTVNAFLKNINWQGGVFEGDKCIDFHFGPRDELISEDLYNKLANGNLNQEIIYNNPLLKSIVVNRIIFFCPGNPAQNIISNIKVNPQTNSFLGVWTKDMNAEHVTEGILEINQKTAVYLVLSNQLNLSFKISQEGGKLKLFYDNSKSDWGNLMRHITNIQLKDKELFAICQLVSNKRINMMYTNQKFINAVNAYIAKEPFPPAVPPFAKTFYLTGNEPAFQFMDKK